MSRDLRTLPKTQLHLLRAGMPVAPASDDPLLFEVGLAGQYEVAREALGLPDEALAAIARLSSEASTTPEDVKADLLAGVNRWLD